MFIRSAQNVGAVRIAGIGGHWTVKRTRLLTLAALLVVPALYGVMQALSSYDDSAGLSTARQYAGLRIGQTRTTLHGTLGREGTDVLAVDFPPVAPGLLCDYLAARPSLA
jgi:hypothetical protein